MVWGNALLESRIYNKNTIKMHCKQKNYLEERLPIIHPNMSTAPIRHHNYVVKTLLTKLKEKLSRKIKWLDFRIKIALCFKSK